MVGVIVNTAVVGAGVQPELDASDQFFVCGIAERGLTNQAMVVRSMTDVANAIGSRTTSGYLWDTLNLYFNEGGEQAWIARVVGTGATPGILTGDLLDSGPVATLGVTAASPGTWSSSVTVQVAAGSTPNSFRIMIALAGIIVQDEDNLLNPAAAVARFSTSNYVRLADRGSATVAPGNNPVVRAASALTAGTAGAAVVSADYITAINTLFPRGLGPGAVAIPGLHGAPIWSGIDLHCRANNRVGLLGTDPLTPAKSALVASGTALNSEWCGMFAPWVYVSDNLGGIMPIPCEGAVAGLRAAQHRRRGAWSVPAGPHGETVSILSLAQSFTAAEYNELDAARVSMFRSVANEFKLYGYRSMSSFVYQWAWLSYRDFCNWIVMRAELVMEDYVFLPIDAKGRLLGQLRQDLIGILDPLSNRALYPFYNNRGKKLDPGYRVQTGDEINTPQTLALNEIRAQMKLRFSPVAGQITLDIIKYGAQSRMNEGGY